MTRMFAAALATTLYLPIGVGANGGSWTEHTTRGAVTGGSASALGPSGLVTDDEVECLSETLTIKLAQAGVGVQVDYVFLNHGPTKSLDYGFPFAVGETELQVEEGRGTKRRSQGEPASYAITVDGAKTSAVVRPGAAVTEGIPVPRLVGNGGRSRTRWSYRVSRIEFPEGKPRKVQVRYQVPYLVYTMSGEGGNATSPGAFSYLLSTGGGWRGGTIGSLRVAVASDAIDLPTLRFEGLPLVRERERWSFEAKEFKPTLKSNLLIRRSEMGALKVTPYQIYGSPTPSFPWTSAPVDGGARPALSLHVRSPSWPEKRRRYRLGLKLDETAARLKRMQVALGDGELHANDVFNATFAPATAADLAANAGYRYVWFEATSWPVEIALTMLEVAPGAGGERWVQIDDVVMEVDMSNDDAS